MYEEALIMNFYVGNLSWYVTSHLGQLNLPSFQGR